MLNTLSTNYQDSMKVWKLNPVYDAGTSSNEREIISYVTPHQDTISVSDEAQSFLRMDNIDQELDAIFGTPQKLSSVQQRELNQIMSEIDKIYMKEHMGTIENIYSQIDAIYAQGELTTVSEKKLADLDKKLNELFMHNSNAEISKEDEEKLTHLNAKIDALYGTKEPSTSELNRAQTLLTEKETLFASLFVERGLAQSYMA
ncbi:MAG: hypothetical protein K0U47_00385 [Epsilonproteobacteria bacterium]|nr:hypothetical protein [Campylobacterota bacterium]